MKANDIQHGGKHYQADYQHWDLVADLQLNYYLANATKYMTRHRSKNGREDVLKAMHYLDKYIELIEQERMPPPLDVPVLVGLARQETVNRYFDANGIDEDAEQQFFLNVCSAHGTESLLFARRNLETVLEARYSRPTNPSQVLVPVNVAAAMDNRFGPEGYWGDGRVLWKCRSCGGYFEAMDGVVPSAAHACDGSEPTREYVDQDR